tara:strand:- start:312 stop:560 length:249 start_codon:yes stop_codon:yes gene_type:complete
MNLIRVVFLIIGPLFSFISVSFLINYNSLENIEKRCTSKFQKDLKNASDKYDEEWNLILDEADINFLECIGIPQNLIFEKQK